MENRKKLKKLNGKIFLENVASCLGKLVHLREFFNYCK